MKTKYCGNCKSFIPSIDGFGACTEPTSIYGVHCNNEACSMFKMKSNNGWTELTPDSLEELGQIEPYRVVVARFFDDGSVKSRTRTEPCYTSLEAAATNTKLRFFYYVLPELKIE